MPNYLMLISETEMEDYVLNHASNMFLIFMYKKLALYHNAYY